VTRGKVVGLPSEFIERGAEAVFEARSNDTVVIARKVLEAALHTVTDLKELLQAQQPAKPARPRAQPQPVVEATASA
jgi:hypothetical protein